MLSEGGGSCTNSTSYAVGSWVGNGTNFTIVDTPGFQDSDEVRIFFPGTDPIKIYSAYSFATLKFGPSDWSIEVV